MSALAWFVIGACFGVALGWVLGRGIAPDSAFYAAAPDPNAATPAQH